MNHQKSELGERPLVTFAVFSYNQEQYIGDAVEAALAQDYPNLEVIISDDCSTDETYQIIKEVINIYEGPHKVIARQTSHNRGTLLHVVDVARITSGKLMVLAAGDDISKKDRARILHGAWVKTGAWGLCSRYDTVDSQGRVIQKDVLPEVFRGHTFTPYFFENEGPIKIIHGCTSAYDIRAFNPLTLSDEDFILSEDGLMSVLLNLMGKKIIQLDESLVMYRENPGSLTNGKRSGELSYQQVKNDELKIEWFARAQANRCRLFLRLESMLGPLAVRRLRTDQIIKDMIDLEIRGSWSSISSFHRISYVLSNLFKKNSYWAHPRILGMPIFYILKWIFNRVRKAI